MFCLALLFKLFFPFAPFFLLFLLQFLLVFNVAVSLIFGQSRIDRLIILLNCILSVCSALFTIFYFQCIVWSFISWWVIVIWTFLVWKHLLFDFVPVQKILFSHFHMPRCFRNLFQFWFRTLFWFFHNVRDIRIWDLNVFAFCGTMIV